MQGEDSTYPLMITSKYCYLSEYGYNYFLIFDLQIIKLDYSWKLSMPAFLDGE